MESDNGRWYEHLLMPSVFRNLFVFMIVFGLIIGLVFPVFVHIMLGVDQALSVGFFAMCVMAGTLVGLVNFLLFDLIVSRHLSSIVLGMRSVLDRVASAETEGFQTSPFQLQITSADVIGDIERAFNQMTNAIAQRLALDGTVRSLHATLSASVELDDVSHRLLAALAGVCGAKAGVLYGDTGESFDRLASFGVDRMDKLPTKIDARQGPIAGALETGAMHSLSPAHDGLEWLEQSTPLGSFRPESVVVIPLVAEQRSVGLAVLACGVGELDHEELQIVESLRVQAAPHLQNAMLHRKITDLAALDDLTKILNRRFGLRRLSEEFSRSVRHGIPISVLMFDLDHFKNINDSFGHDAGDVLLKMVASTLEANLRAGDVVCRYGGEEFMVVNPGTGLRDAATLAERLRRMVETSPVSWKVQRLSTTVSIGVATWPIASVSVSEELVTAADTALYAAKDAGRNRVFALLDGRTIPIGALDAGVVGAGMNGSRTSASQRGSQDS